MSPHKDAEEDLDFTAPVSQPSAVTPEAAATARKEAATGGPQLQKSGFYVAMAKHAEEPIAPRNGERHVVLIVEDDPALSNLVAEVLAKAGFLTLFGRNRAEINAQFNKPMLPDLVLLDVSLPDADGFSILSRIRAHLKVAGMPVIMMTARSDVADVARGLSLGADGYVTKPFKITALVTAVKTVLGIE